MTRHDAHTPDDSARDGTERESLTLRCSWDGADFPSLDVVRAVAIATQTEPAAMSPLYTAIDPTALDGLFASGRPSDRPRTLSFRFEGCAVTVDSDGRITVEPLE